MLDKVNGWIKSATSTGVALIALTIVLQIIFGGGVPFLGGDIIGTITGIIATLGGEGLVGILAAAVIYKLFTSTSSK
jgi:hypothetical protein|tara:strand:+ start:112 stop:342 length:231 start_codon:yes stop_codon:yes gene_type:complete